MPDNWDIRIDLLLIWPVLAIVFLAGVISPDISQRLSREVGKGCGYEARVEKHPQALTESLFSRLPISMLRMFFKRNEVDTMLSGFVADRL